MRRYRMQDNAAAAAQAAFYSTRLLEEHDCTVKIVNVEDDPAYRAKDVDLLWFRDDRDDPVEVEVKGDLQAHATANYAFETASAAEYSTKGCFMYTTAAYVHYWVMGKRECHVLPMPAVRDWFKANLARFGPERACQTPSRAGGYYTTKFHLVPIREVLLADVGARIRPCENRAWASAGPAPDIALRA